MVDHDSRGAGTVLNPEGPYPQTKRAFAAHGPSTAAARAEHTDHATHTEHRACSRRTTPTTPGHHQLATRHARLHGRSTSNLSTSPYRQRIRSALSGKPLKGLQTMRLQATLFAKQGAKPVTADQQGPGQPGHPRNLKSPHNSTVCKCARQPAPPATCTAGRPDARSQPHGKSYSCPLAAAHTHGYGRSPRSQHAGQLISRSK